MSQFTEKLSTLPRSFVDIASLLAAGAFVHLFGKDNVDITLRLTLGGSAHAVDVPKSVVFMILCFVLLALVGYTRWLVADALAWWRA